jgi:hypothetical protein
VNNQHPITPSRELAQQWTDQIYGGPGAVVGSDDLCLAKLAAQWGADQELEACLRHLDAKGHHPTVLDALSAARRPKPPSLKEQALADLSEIGSHYIGPGTAQRIDTIRRALENLPDD